MEEYVFADLYAWLEAHSGLSESFFKPTNVFTNTANTSSLNTNKTSQWPIIISSNNEKNRFYPKTY
jgi:hypothetical protein